MEHGTKIIKGGCIIHTSKNLRGLIDYARISPVVRIESCPIGENDVSGTVRVFFADGAESRANFRSYGIMIDWLRNRRNWRSAKHIMQGPDIGYFTIPGTIAGTIKTVRDSHIHAALETLNAKRGKSYSDIGYSYYADIKGDGRNMRQVYTIISEGGGVTRSHMNGATKRKTLTLIEAEIAKA